MPNRRKSMRKIKEVLRLKYVHELSERQIARSCGIGKTTVAEYLMRARAAGLGWPLPVELDEASIEARLFPVTLGKAERGQPAMPDFEQLHRELKSHKHLTLQLVWQEYKEAHPEGYQYSQFCELYRKWAKKLDLVLRGSHRAGEKLFVDYAGETVPVIDTTTGEKTETSIFVAVLGASSYTYAEATLKANLESWIGSHVRTLEYIGGCPEVLVPDNLKDGVKLPCRYEPDLNPTYQEMAAHYGVAVIPARVRKPRDKAKAEAGVLLVERWILAALRKQTFFTIGELNQAIRELLEKLNSRRFRKMSGSRLQLFEQIDRPALLPLPVQRYTFAQWKWSRVSNDYHVELGQHYY
ncbi:MAG: IS21 family transposase, partial [Pyrinomonadaceae bacterium]